MHPAEHRALRELHVIARQLASHWDQLARRLDDDAAAALLAGAADARALIEDLAAATDARGLHARSAVALAARVASARPMAPDHLLERNQALRHALLDLQHCLTLLAYTAALAAASGDEPLRALLAGWEERLRPHERALRAAILALAARPDDAIAPAIPSMAGRVGLGLAATGGAIGEWVDERAARRSG
jgi:hypothetical protein